MRAAWPIVLACAGLVACGGETEADRLGVGAACEDVSECADDIAQCLDQFKGGYCGIDGCEEDLDCPEGSACIAHTDGTNYCFRVCVDKAECNRHRAPENESNCSSNIDFVDGAMGRKACVPPSG